MTIPFCNAMMVKERQEMVKRVFDWDNGKSEPQFRAHLQPPGFRSHLQCPSVAVGARWEFSQGDPNFAQQCAVSIGEQVKRQLHYISHDHFMCIYIYTKLYRHTHLHTCELITCAIHGTYTYIVMCTITCI